MLEDLIINTLLEGLKKPALVKELVNHVYALQEREPPEITSIKARIRQIDTAISNILEAIKIGIFTKSTKVELENLEKQKEDLEDNLSHVIVATRKFSKEEIKEDIALITSMDYETTEQKRSLIVHFVDKVIVHGNGKIVLYADFFGIKKEVTDIEKEDSKVRIQDAVAHH